MTQLVCMFKLGWQKCATRRVDNRMLFTIQSINSSFMYYFKLQKPEFIQLIDDMTIDL